MTFARRGRALLIALALLAGVTACTSSGSPGGHSSGPSAQVTTSIAAPTLPAPSSTAAPPTTPALTSTPASTPPVRSTTAAQQRSTCTNVTVRVIRGGADLGQELVALQFTNAATKPCLLVGYPAATLLRHGDQVGTPAQPRQPGVTSRITLAPGETAESRLTATTTCQAPLSDEVKVVVPGSTTTVLRQAELRACVLRVTPLGPPE